MLPRVRLAIYSTCGNASEITGIMI